MTIVNKMQIHNDKMENITIDEVEAEVEVEEAEKTMIVETNNNTISIMRINFKEKEEDAEAITQQLIDQSYQISSMLNATDVIDMAIIS
ncbi:hypothetical protein JRO89_XS01G0080600 [Xanthoceras sorbifolium]|uniref:Uncharacterized protein n=1 Tax=Xanthoceras sorbifolium TaxID=99658 RepID=A0ABQ8IIE7_9ROSI|nr:hypothetical protein JRO89_XS01G0080600 [Xanthoceras sorbifolium]